MNFLTFFERFGGLLLTSVILLVYFILILVKYIKAKRQGKKITLADIYEEIPKLVGTAEKLFTNKGMGQAKLDHVLTHLKLDAVNNGFKLDVSKATNMINDIVEATKICNTGMIIPIVDSNKND